MRKVLESCAIYKKATKKIIFTHVVHLLVSFCQEHVSINFSAEFLAIIGKKLVPNTATSSILKQFSLIEFL